MKSPLFIQKLNSVGEYGKGLKSPSYYEARVSYLIKDVEAVEANLEKFKDKWKKMA